MGRRTLLVVAAVLIAAIGTTLIWLYVQGADARAREAAQATVELRPVLVTTSSVAAGTVLPAGSTKEVQVPAELAADAATQADIAETPLSIDVVPYTILRRSMLSTDAAPGVPPDYQAVSITIQDPQRVPATLKPRQDVAVYAYGGSAPPELVVAHAYVLTVGSEGGQGQAAAQIIGFRLKPPDARKIADITTSGRQALIMINGKGVTPQP